MTGPFFAPDDITDHEKRRKAELKARYLNWVTRDVDWGKVTGRLNIAIPTYDDYLSEGEGPTALEFEHVKWPDLIKTTWPKVGHLGFRSKESGVVYPRLMTQLGNHEYDAVVYDGCDWRIDDTLEAL